MFLCQSDLLFLSLTNVTHHHLDKIYITAKISRINTITIAL